MTKKNLQLFIELDEESKEKGEKKTIEMRPKKWHPIHLLWEWSEGPGEPQIVSILFVLPTGVNNSKVKVAYQVNTTYNGLTIRVTWPEEIINTKEIHKWVAVKKNVPYHPRQLMFERALSEFRAHASESITTTTTIPLPFKVLSKIKEQRRLEFKNKTTSVVYIDLEADKRSDYMDAEEEDKIVILE